MKQTTSALDSSVADAPGSRVPATEVPPVLRLLPVEAQAFLLERAERRKAVAGATLTTVGEKCGELWFFDAGLVDAQRPDAATGEWMPEPLLRAGDVYGSHALDAKGAAHSVRLTALTGVAWFALDAGALAAGALRFPEVALFCSAVLRSPSIRGLLLRMVSLMPGEEERLLELAGAFVRTEVAPGQVLQERGAPVEALRVVEHGSVSAAGDGGANEPRSMGAGGDGSTNVAPALLLTEGSLLAEAALLFDLPSPVRITAAEASGLQSISRARLDALFAACPSLRRALAGLVALDFGGIRVRGSRSLDHSPPPIDHEESGAEREMVPDPDVAPAQAPRWRRVPFIPQQDEMECGAACLRMIHKYHGHDLDPRRARELARVSRYGTSALDLTRAAETLGYQATGVHVDGWDALRQVDLPAIAHVEGNHFVVVWRVDDQRVDIGDPAVDTMRQSRAEFMERFQGVLLLMRPTDAVGRTGPADDAALPATSGSWAARFWPFVRPYRRLLAQILAASVVLQLFGLVLPFMTQAIIDRVIGKGEVHLLNLMFLGLVLMAGFTWLVSWVRAYLLIHGAVGIERSVIQSIFDRMLSLPHSFFSRYTTGDLVRRFQEVDAVRAFFVDHGIYGLLDVILVAGYGTILFVFQPRMAAIYFALLAFNGLLVFRLARPVQRLTSATIKKYARVDSLIIDSFIGIEPVKALALERPFGSWFGSLLQPALDQWRRASLLSVSAWLTAEAIDSVNGALLLFGGASLVLKGTLSVGQLMAFLMLANGLTAPFLRLLDQWRSLQTTLVSLRRIGNLMDEVPEREVHQRRGPTVALPRLRGEIRIDNVTFRYTQDVKEKAANVLDSLSLDIRPGEVIGIVGRSGCGKSTLARLLLRFHDPTAGRILIDGVELRDLDTASLRSQIGLVTQEAFLYRATIRNNISCFRNVSDDDVVRAARAAGAYEFISDLPYGFETRVGESGLQLSGGQRQRIVIARALCADPRILIFDEATAALDPLIEQEIHEGLRTALRGRTTLIIAHRLNTLRHVDRIAVLERGRLAEIGTHLELVARRGIYHRMLAAAPDWHGGDGTGAAE